MCVYIQYQSLLDKHAGRLAAQLPRDSETGWARSLGAVQGNIRVWCGQGITRTTPTSEALIFF